jgi:tetratricopeptide (TPR) repeat protein
VILRSKTPLGLLIVALLACAAAPAQQAGPAPGRGELILVLPFDNQVPSPNVDWIGAAAPEILNRRFSSANLLPISRADRLYALDHLGLPTDFHPSRASAIRLAQALDANYVVFGTYRVDGTGTSAHITADARLLDVGALRLSAPIEEQSDLAHLPNVFNALAWRLTRQLNPAFPVAEQTFISTDAALRLDAFENYIRGLVEPSPEERIRHLREALRLNPGTGADAYPAWFALGQAEFAAQNYEEAAAAFGHLAQNDPDALEADFYRGLAFFYTGKYLQAEDAFAFVSTRLPLPEVVNNQGVAAARRGHDGAPLFQQAITADPRDADYHFNVALSFARRGDTAHALGEIDQAIKLHPDDPEAQAFANNLRTQGASAFAPVADAGGSAPATGPGRLSLPLERIKRSYNETGFRQAAYAMEQVEAQRVSTLPPAQRAAQLAKNGNAYLNTGLLVEAEREFQLALSADSAADAATATAHAGLAQVRERTANRDAARQEAQLSLAAAPNVPAHLVLARIDLASNQLPLASNEVSQALHLDPLNSSAKGLRDALVSRGQQVPQ